jgi:hypothetical protein
MEARGTSPEEMQSRMKADIANGRRDREGRHRSAVSKNKESPKRPQLGDVFFDPEAV